MKTYGIIAEYNPFHNGHRYQIEETRKRTGCDVVAVLMSGDFTQRGEPALLDKWTRAEAAVRCGADLVLELPAVFACSSAEHFAFGGVGILEGLGVLEGISFGVEADPPEALMPVAELLAEERPEFQDNLREGLSDGMSYAAARSRAVRDLAGSAAAQLISQPNNILAIEYLKQIIRRSSGLKPLMIRRKAAGYDNADYREGIAGAGWIRETIRGGAELKELSGIYPEKLKDLYGSADCVSMGAFFPIMMYALRNGKDLERIDGVTEGLENRAQKAAKAAENMEGFLEAVKSKRYSRTSVSRMMLRILLGVTKEEMEAFESNDRYAVRVLGFSPAGARLLRRIRKQEDSRVSVITNVNRQKPEDPLLQKMLEYDSLAADLYDLVKNGRMGEHAEYKMKPYRAEAGR